jgi:hypothetical protein
VRHVPFPHHLTDPQCIIGGLRFDFNCRAYPIIGYFISLFYHNNVIVLKIRISNWKIQLNLKKLLKNEVELEKMRGK